MVAQKDKQGCVAALRQLRHAVVPEDHQEGHESADALLRRAAAVKQKLLATARAYRAAQQLREGQLARLAREQIIMRCYDLREALHGRLVDMLQQYGADLLELPAMSSASDPQKYGTLVTGGMLLGGDPVRLKQAAAAYYSLPTVAATPQVITAYVSKYQATFLGQVRVQQQSAGGDNTLCMLVK